MMHSEEEPVTGEWRADGQTAVGSVIGSAAHMSPEQIVGREVDCRSDLFSLGVALYEMATGRLPFTGATRAEMIERILHALPESITTMNHDIPFELERITLRCLEFPEATLAAMKRAHAEIKEAYEAGGCQEATRCILKHAPKEAGRGNAGLVLAVLHAEAGDLDAAFEHLDRAIDARDPGLVHLAVAPQWDSLRDDPRFNQRLARMRLDPVS